jgi:excinuclease ABC subunit A
LKAVLLSDSAIHVRGARTHNLQGIDLDLPIDKLIAICGVSGSGKSSLAVDTLYAEGQRRYAETFSAFARQFLERLERPDVERIDGLPPPILVYQSGRNAGRRETVGTATELHELLSLWFAEWGEVICPTCDLDVRRHRVEEVASLVDSLPGGTRMVVAYPAEPLNSPHDGKFAEHVRSLGFRRLIIGESIVEVESGDAANPPAQNELERCEVVVDRLIVGRTERDRLVESLAAARDHGAGRYVVYVEAEATETALGAYQPQPAMLDGRCTLRCELNEDFVCSRCGHAFVGPEPRLFSFHGPVGACPACAGLGHVEETGGKGRSQRGKKVWEICAACLGQRLRPEALAVRLGGKSIVDVSEQPAVRLAEFVRELNCASHEGGAAQPTVTAILARLSHMAELGIGHLPLARPLRSVSRGEAQRVALCRTVSSSLVNVLYVLDEPTVGLHAADMEAAVRVLTSLRDRGNTVIVVEHEADVLRSADMLVEMGPGAGQEGGRVVFAGAPQEIVQSPGSATGDWLAGRRGALEVNGRRPIEHGSIRLVGARSKNLRGITVEFPLGVLCVVTGVSGAGKTALVEHALYPAVRERLGGQAVGKRTWDDVQGTGQVEHVELVTQSPPARSARSNPVTYVKAFDAIRQVFAETIDATTRNYGPGFFSFNVEGGRCESCKGEGRLTVDMQFLPNLVMVCPECNGRRYTREALAVQYRGRSIADVLEMTVREALAFFRGQRAVQSRLACLKDVGLDYLRLGQPLGTLSGGEAQRMKLASFLQTKRAGRTLFLLDEPTAGLFATDVLKLLDCFDALLAVGHSIVAVTHNLALVRAADYVIELGPGAGEGGGQLVATGTPEEIATDSGSKTGCYL